MRPVATLRSTEGVSRIAALPRAFERYQPSISSVVAWSPFAFQPVIRVV